MAWWKGLMSKEAASFDLGAFHTEGSEILDFCHSLRCWMCCWMVSRFWVESFRNQVLVGVKFLYERTPSPLLKSFQRVWFVQTLWCIWVLGG